MIKFDLKKINIIRFTRYFLCFHNLCLYYKFISIFLCFNSKKNLNPLNSHRKQCLHLNRGGGEGREMKREKNKKKNRCCVSVELEKKIKK